MDLDANIELDNDVELDELNQGKQPTEAQYDDKLNEDYGVEWDFLVLFVKVCVFGLWVLLALTVDVGLELPKHVKYCCLVWMLYFIDRVNKLPLALKFLL